MSAAPSARCDTRESTRNYGWKAIYQKWPRLDAQGMKESAMVGQNETGFWRLLVSNNPREIPRPAEVLRIFWMTASNESDRVGFEGG
jgi:hypothetical protein